MIEKEFSLITLVIYIFMALIIAFLFKKAIWAKNNKKTFKIGSYDINFKYFYYLLITLIFVIFSSFRYISDGIGGADTYNYINYFKSLGYVPFDLKNTLIFNGYEYLFYNTMFIVRILGGNYRIFLIIINILMTSCLIYVVEHEFKNENDWYYFILFFLPLLKSLNIVRNCLAACLFFVSVSNLNHNNYKKSLLFIILAYLNHYMAILGFVLILFYKYFPEKILLDKRKIIMLNIASIVMSIVSLPVIKHILLNTGYCGYVSKMQVSLIGYMPYIAIYVLMLYDKNFIHYLKSNAHFGYYKIMYFLSLVLPLFMIMNAANRILLLFEVPIVVILVDIVNFYIKKVPYRYHKLYKCFCISIVFCYYVFRILRIWDGYGLMPYYNIIFM